MSYKFSFVRKCNLMCRFSCGIFLVMASAAMGGNFSGSTLVSNPIDFQLELIYQKFSPDEAVVPGVSWLLSFGALLDGTPASIGVTLSLDPAGQNADIQIIDSSATFVLQGTLSHNYDSAEQFEILYTGTLDPFVGPIDFLLEPDGLAAIPVRVHLNVIQQPGFPVPFVTGLQAASPVADISGDDNLEIIVPGNPSGGEGLYAYDDTGTQLPGWPFRVDEPEIVNQSFSTPALVDLDGDGKNEIVSGANILRNLPNRGVNESVVASVTLFAINGDGSIRWQVTDDIKAFASPAVADLDGDSILDIIIGGDVNLIRYDQDGVRVAGWQAEVLNDIHVDVPVIADVDGNPGNGLEIVGCTFLPGLPRSSQLYVWNEDGSIHDPAWPITMEECVAPAVVDLDGDSTNGLELIMAIEHEQPDVDAGTGFLNTFTVFAWHANGTDVNGWPHRFMRDPNTNPDDRVVSSPSVGDLDGDGDLEVVVGTYGQGDQANGNLFVFHHDGTLDSGWPQWAGTAQTPSPWGGRALGDLDNDGKLEIVTASFLGVYVFRADGSRFEGFPRLTGEVFAQPMIADIDRDGRLEIVNISIIESLSVWKILSPSPDPQPWPRFRKNPARTGARNGMFAISIPTISEVGLAIMLGLMLLAGAYIIRKNVEAR